MAFTNTPLTLAGMAALPLVLGLAADHGIMVTHDLAHGMELGVERAVLVASLTAIVGMGLLAFAHHPALNAMGKVIFLGLLVEVPAALWLLPRLCRIVPCSSRSAA
jgi:predicted RND superfamily exporter protein